MIRKQEGTFLSEADGLEISALCIMPEEKTEYRAVVQLVHGMSEHKERYIPFMEYLAKKGYITVIHDHRGHGKSVKNSDDLGYMYGGGARGNASGYRNGEQRDTQAFSGPPCDFVRATAWDLWRFVLLQRSMMTVSIC